MFYRTQSELFQHIIRTERSVLMQSPTVMTYHTGLRPSSLRPNYLDAFP
jgi:hypothetical protein